MKIIKEKIRRSLRYHYLKFIRIKARPKEVASGMALGLFIGMSPTMGFQMPIALFFAALLGENKLAAVLGVWVTNPLTAPVIYPINYEVGAYFIGHFFPVAASAAVNFNNIAQLGFHIVINLVTGGIIVGIFTSMIGYFATLWLVIAHREKKALKAHQAVNIDLNDQITVIPPAAVNHREEVTYH
ncbi:MAG: DUF2062 domain-containing protein [bacterium]